MGLSRRRFTRQFKLAAIEWPESNRVAQLERKIGQQRLEVDFLKGCLQRIEQQQKLQAMIGKPPSTSRSKTREMEPQS